MPLDNINEIDDIFWRLETIVRTSPEYLRKVKPKWKHLEQTATNTARLFKLQKRWPDIPQSVLLELNTQQSVPFVTVMLGLLERRYVVNQVSMIQWWRRMVATGQDALLTYFSWKRFEETFTGRMVTAQDLIRVCSDNEAFLTNVGKVLADDQSVDFKIRELLGGLSMKSDVRKAFREWAMTNHPDKGGDAEKFLAVKLVYDEWLDIQKNNTQQQKDEL